MDKVCTKCQVAKPLEDFSPSKRTKDGLHCWCKQCSKEAARVWRKTKPDQYKRNYERYHAAHAGIKQIHSELRRRKDPIHVMLTGAKNRAKQEGARFNITSSDVERVTHCPILGIELDYFSKGSGTNAPNMASLDRVDPELGYVKGNGASFSVS